MELPHGIISITIISEAFSLSIDLGGLLLFQLTRHPTPQPPHSFAIDGTFNSQENFKIINSYRSMTNFLFEDV